MAVAYDAPPPHYVDGSTPMGRNKPQLGVPGADVIGKRRKEYLDADQKARTSPVPEAEQVNDMQTKKN